MKVAVTGASGFVGRYVVEALVDAGREVVALGRTDASLAHLARPQVTVRATDYAESDLEIALQGVDAVVHLAGRRTLREDEPLRFGPFVDPNLLTLDGLLSASKRTGVQSVVLISTTAVYSAANQSPYRETDAPRPLNPYGLSKLYSEQMVDLWARGGAFKATSLRVAACYGHGERISAVLMRFVSEAMAKRTLTIRGNRQISVEQIYVRDVASAVLAALGGASSGGVFNIGPGRTATLVEMAEAVNDAFDNAGNLAFEDPVEGETKQNFMDVSRASEILGWRPRFDLASGLRDLRDTWRRGGGA